MMAPELKRKVEIKMSKTVKLSIFPGMGRWEIKFSAWPHCSQQQNKVKLFIYYLLKYILKSRT
jgi:hypothetical protein